jgi:branched-chain amino acid transport system permease protein
MANPRFLVFSDRMLRAAALDASVYEEIEADPSAVRQSLAVVLLSSMAAGIGAGGWQGSSLRTFVLFTLVALATWTAWAWLVAEIGRRLLPETQTRTSFAELLRTIGLQLPETSTVLLGRTIEVPSGTRIVVVSALMALVLILRPNGLTGGHEFSFDRLARRLRPAVQEAAR